MSGNQSKSKKSTVMPSFRPVVVRPDGLSSAPPVRGMDPPSLPPVDTQKAPGILVAGSAPHQATLQSPQAPQGVSFDALAATAPTLDGPGAANSNAAAPKHTHLAWQPPSTVPPVTPAWMPDQDIITREKPEDDTVEELEDEALESVPEPIPKRRERSRVDAAVAGGDERRLTYRALLFAGLGGLLFMALVVGLVLVRRPAAHATAAPPAAQPEPSAAPTLPLAPVACATLEPAIRIAVSASPRVPVLARTPRGQPRVAVGFAEDDETAIAMMVDPSNLGSKLVYRDHESRRVLGVEMRWGRVGPEFVTDRASVSHLREACSVDAPKPFAIGVTNRGVAMEKRLGARPLVIWEMEDTSDVTRPEVVNSSEVEHVVVLRRGGREGEVRLGWFESQTLNKSPLFLLPFEGEFVGSPSLAEYADQVVVAAAVKPDQGAPWRLQLITGSWAEGLGELMRLPLAAGGVGGDVIAPRLAALDDGRWLLQFTEGKPGERIVRVQTFSRDLRPLGDPVTVSPPNSSAGVGAVAGVDGGALSVFLVHRAGGYELWASSLSCH